MNKAVIYNRVGNWDQSGGEAAKEMRRAWCEAKAVSLGAEVVASFDDHNQSPISTDRPGLLQAVRYCNNEGIRTMVVYNPETLQGAGVDTGDIEIIYCQEY